MPSGMSVMTGPGAGAGVGAGVGSMPLQVACTANLNHTRARTNNTLTHIGLFRPTYSKGQVDG